MKFRRALAIFFAVAFAMGLLSACAAETTTADETASASEAAASSSDTTAAAQTNATYVQVQSVDGDTITAVTGTLAQGGMGAQQPGDESGQQAEGTPPEQPSGNENGQQAEGTPSEQPSGDENGQQAEGTPPEQPSGDENGQQAEGTPPEQPSGDGTSQPQGEMSGMFTAGDETITFTVSADTVITLADGSAGEITDLAEGDILAVTLDESSTALTITIQSFGGAPSGMDAATQPGASFGGSDTVTNGTSANTISSDTSVTGETYSSDGDDENALRIDGATVTLDGITINKTGGDSSNTEDGDFYGMNAGLLALNGATTTISNATVTTNAVNGNGVFSYGEGTTVNISDSVIRTTEHNSGGIQTTGGATMNATNLDVETQGASSAAIRSDRGGGDVNVSGGTYTTYGTGSPAVYSTADITVEDAVLTANASEAVVVEGANSVTLNNCTLSGNMTASSDSDENVQNIMIYQSMSGDAEVGHSSFSAIGGSIIANAGDMFYVTNTTCTISLTNVALTLANDTLLNVAGNSSSRGWGTEGENGGDCTFAISGQTLIGNILVDEISSLDFSLSDGSVFTGAINPSGTAGTVGVMLADGCQWVLTADSYITSFTGSVSNIVTNGYTVYVNGTAITD